jgi:hypothetical protein
MRRFIEELYSKRFAHLMATIDAARADMDSSCLTPLETHAYYKYRHWEDAVVDDPYEGPVGMSYGFYTRINGYYVWCGFTFFEFSTQFEHQNRDDVIVVQFLEKPDVFYVNPLPGYIPRQQRQYEVVFDETAQALLKDLGFQYKEQRREWIGLYRASDRSNTDTLVSRVVEDVARLIEIPCKVKRV